MAKGTGFTKFSSADREITLLQDNIDRAFSQQQLTPISNGVLQSTTLVTGANTITHRLGRKPRGYIVVSTSSASSFHDDMASGANDQNFILTSSADCTVNLWIF